MGMGAALRKRRRVRPDHADPVHARPGRRVHNAAVAGSATDGPVERYPARPDSSATKVKVPSELDRRSVYTAMRSASRELLKKLFGYAPR